MKHASGSGGRRNTSWARTLSAAAFWVSLIQSGCSIDPTDQFFPVTVVNDTDRELIIDQCDVKCTSLHDHADLRPGEVMPQNASDASVPAWYVVSDVSGKRLGCLVMQFDHKQPNVRIGLSGMKVCPKEILQ